MKTDKLCDDRWVCKSENVTGAHSSVLMVALSGWHKMWCRGITLGSYCDLLASPHVH